MNPDPKQAALESIKSAAVTVQVHRKSFKGTPFETQMLAWLENAERVIFFLETGKTGDNLHAAGIPPRLRGEPLKGEIDGSKIADATVRSDYVRERGTVNGQAAVIDFGTKTYILVTENMDVLQTIDGKLTVISRRHDDPVQELPLLPSDKVGIQRPDFDGNRWREIWKKL